MLNHAGILKQVFEIADDVLNKKPKKCKKQVSNSKTHNPMNETDYIECTEGGLGVSSLPIR